MIAGEGLIGVALAVLAVVGVDSVLDISNALNLSPAMQNVCGVIVFALVIVSLLRFSVWKKSKK